MLKKFAQRGRSKVHGAMSKERHARARRRDGEPGQFFKTRCTPSLPARPEPAETGSFPVYIEFPSVARTKLGERCGSAHRGGRVKKRTFSASLILARRFSLLDQPGEIRALQTEQLRRFRLISRRLLQRHIDDI
jgi:hypothetical protein